MTWAFLLLSLSGYLLTHPTSPLEAYTRDLLPPLQKTWGAATLDSLILGTLSFLVVVTGALSQLLPAFPSLGRKWLGIKDGKMVAGGGRPAALVGALFFAGAGAFASLTLLGKTQSLPRQPTLSAPLNFATDPAILSDINWSVLPFYQLAGRWPIQLMNEVGRILLGYAPGVVPNRYLPSITFQWEQTGTQLRIEGPKTDETLAQLIRAQKDAVTCSLPCLAILQNQRHAMKASLGADRIRDIKVSPWKGGAMQGLLLQIQTPTLTHWRALIELPAGAYQALTWSEQNRLAQTNDHPLPEAFQKTLAHLGTHSSLQDARAFTNERLSRVNLSALLGEKGGVRDLPQLLKTAEGKREIQSRKEALQGIQHLLLAKLTLEPSSSETFLHLAGTSYLLWKVAIALSDSGTSATARKVIRVTERYLQDFTPVATAELKAVRDIIQEIEAFERK
jgi:hypothetical protein